MGVLWNPCSLQDGLRDRLLIPKGFIDGFRRCHVELPLPHITWVGARRILGKKQAKKHRHRTFVMRTSPIPSFPKSCPSLVQCRIEWV